MREGSSKEANKRTDNVDFKLLSGQYMVFKPLRDDSDSNAELEKDSGQKNSVRATRVARSGKKES